MQRKEQKALQEEDLGWIMAAGVLGRWLHPAVCVDTRRVKSSRCRECFNETSVICRKEFAEDKKECEGIDQTPAVVLIKLGGEKIVFSLENHSVTCCH